MAASESNQQSTTEESLPVEECQISDAAQEAIDEATTAAKESSRNKAFDLIDQAELVAKPPECDSVKAKMLADKAKSSKSSASETSSDCWELAAGAGKIGQEARATSEFEEFGALFGISTSATAAVTALLCLPTATTAASAVGEETAYRKMQQYRLVAIARDDLANDMARGGGEYVAAMAYLNGCPVEVHDSFAQMTQRNFNQIFPQPDLDPGIILLNLEAQIAKDPLLVVDCSEFS